MDQNETLKAHPFQRTLGPGPYRFIGAGRISISETFGARYIGPQCERGAGTCAHCNHAILNVFVIETSEGRRFGVGSDCILKVGIEAKELTKVQKEVRKHAKEVRDARKAKKQETARIELANLLETHVLTLNALPHPSIDGLTLYQYVTWILSRPSNKVFALKRIQSILQNSPQVIMQNADESNN